MKLRLDRPGADIRLFPGAFASHEGIRDEDGCSESQEPAVLRRTIVFDDPHDDGRIVKEPSPDRRQALQRRRVVRTAPV